MRAFALAAFALAPLATPVLAQDLGADFNQLPRWQQEERMRSLRSYDNWERQDRVNTLRNYRWGWGPNCRSEPTGRLGRDGNMHTRQGWVCN